MKEDILNEPVIDFYNENNLFLMLRETDFPN
jgi:hypothetical protein